MMFIPRRLLVASLVLFASIGQADAQSFADLLVFLARAYIFLCPFVEPFLQGYIGIGLPGCGLPPQFPTPSPMVVPTPSPVPLGVRGVRAVSSPVAPKEETP